MPTALQSTLGLVALSSGSVRWRRGHHRRKPLVLERSGFTPGYEFEKGVALRSGPRVTRLGVFALDAAMPFDYESIKKQEMKKQNRLKVGIVGFGNFGQFIAKRVAQHGHQVLAFSRTDYTESARAMGVRFLRDPDDFCEEHPEVVILCTSILSTEKVLRSLPVQRLKRSTLFVDVLSVKEFPKRLFEQVLPPDFDLLCTHPMFGPESGKGSWSGLPFVYDKVRVGPGRRSERCKRFLDIFEKEGCRMVEMTCEEHDKFAASSQFITHTVGRVLGQLQLESTPINTKGYETLLSLVDNTCKDSFDLYYGLFMYNINATEELERLERAFDHVKKQLFDQLHDILRGQLFGQKAAVTVVTTQGSPLVAVQSLVNTLGTTVQTPISGNGGVLASVSHEELRNVQAIKEEPVNLTMEVPQDATSIGSESQ